MDIKSIIPKKPVETVEEQSVRLMDESVARTVEPTNFVYENFVKDSQESAIAEIQRVDKIQTNATFTDKANALMNIGVDATMIGSGITNLVDKYGSSLFEPDKKYLATKDTEHYNRVNALVSKGMGLTEATDYYNSAKSQAHLDYLISHDIASKGRSQLFEDSVAMNQANIARIVGIVTEEAIIGRVTAGVGMVGASLSAKAGQALLAEARLTNDVAKFNAGIAKLEKSKTVGILAGIGTAGAFVGVRATVKDEYTALEAVFDMGLGILFDVGLVNKQVKKSLAIATADKQKTLAHIENLRAIDDEIKAGLEAKFKAEEAKAKATTTAPQEPPKNTGAKATETKGNTAQKDTSQTTDDIPTQVDIDMVAKTAKAKRGVQGTIDDTIKSEREVEAMIKDMKAEPLNTIVGSLKAQRLKEKLSPTAQLKSLVNQALGAKTEADRLKITQRATILNATIKLKKIYAKSTKSQSAKRKTTDALRLVEDISKEVSKLGSRLPKSAIDSDIAEIEAIFGGKLYVSLSKDGEVALTIKRADGTKEVIEKKLGSPRALLAIGAVGAMSTDAMAGDDSDGFSIAGVAGVIIMGLIGFHAFKSLRANPESVNYINKAMDSIKGIYDKKLPTELSTNKLTEMTVQTTNAVRTFTSIVAYCAEHGAKDTQILSRKLWNNTADTKFGSSHMTVESVLSTVFRQQQNKYTEFLENKEMFNDYVKARGLDNLSKENQFEELGKDIGRHRMGLDDPTIPTNILEYYSKAQDEIYASLLNQAKQIGVTGFEKLKPHSNYMKRSPKLLNLRQRLTDLANITPKKFNALPQVIEFKKALYTAIDSKTRLKHMQDFHKKALADNIEITDELIELELASVTQNIKKYVDEFANRVRLSNTTTGDITIVDIHKVSNRSKMKVQMDYKVLEDELLARGVPAKVEDIFSVNSHKLIMEYAHEVGLSISTKVVLNTSPEKVMARLATEPNDIVRTQQLNAFNELRGISNYSTTGLFAQTLLTAGQVAQVFGLKMSVISNMPELVKNITKTLKTSGFGADIKTLAEDLTIGGRSTIENAVSVNIMTRNLNKGLSLTTDASDGLANIVGILGKIGGASRAVLAQTKIFGLSWLTDYTARLALTNTVSELVKYAHGDLTMLSKIDVERLGLVNSDLAIIKKLYPKIDDGFIAPNFDKISMNGKAQELTEMFEYTAIVNKMLSTSYIRDNIAGRPDFMRASAGGKFLGSLLQSSTQSAEMIGVDNLVKMTKGDNGAYLSTMLWFGTLVGASLAKQIIAGQEQDMDKAVENALLNMPLTSGVSAFGTVATGGVNLPILDSTGANIYKTLGIITTGVQN